MVSAEIQAGATFSVGKQRTLFSASQFFRPGPIPSFSLSAGRQAIPDGARGGGDASRAS